MNRIVVVSVLFAFFVMVDLASPAIAQASTDAVLILHFDEGSGTIAKDESGHGNDGTIYGATWVDGKYGKALRFDGVDDYVDCGNDASLDATGEITVEAWVKFASTANSYYAVLDKRGGTGIYEFYWKKSDTTMRFNLGGTSTTFTPLLGQWYHIAASGIVGQSGQGKIYINGVDVTSDPGGIPPSVTGGSFTIGAYGSGSGEFFNGIIDEVKVYNRALPAEEIKAHYEGKKPALTLTKSASPSTIQEGETTTISIRIENTGTGDAKSVEVTDTIPLGFKIISGSKSASFNEIKLGDYRTLEYTLKATGTGKFTCDPATATYKDTDGNSNSAASNSVSIQVGGEVPVGADSDGDGWSDEKEREMGTNPYSVDSDGDGLKDTEDPNPTVPEEKKTPGFEALFAIAGLLAVAYILRKRK